MGEINHYDYVVICHLFYPEEIDHLLEKLSAFERFSTLFIFNIATPSKQNTIALVQKKFPAALFFTTPKKGRDIGAKLFLINVLLQLGIHADYAFIVHDKKSPHISDGSKWRDDLLSVIEPRNLLKVPEVFADSRVGIIASKNYIQDEYNPALNKFSCTSDLILRKLIKKMELKMDDFRFVAGSIFLVRFDILERFFSGKTGHIPDIIAELEPGNSLDFFKGTYLHSWERMLSWTATSQGYTIYGL